MKIQHSFGIMITYNDSSHRLVPIPILCDTQTQLSPWVLLGHCSNLGSILTVHGKETETFLLDKIWYPAFYPYAEYYGVK